MVSTDIHSFDSQYLKSVDCSPSKPSFHARYRDCYSGSLLFGFNYRSLAGLGPHAWWATGPVLCCLGLSGSGAARSCFCNRIVGLRRLRTFPAINRSCLLSLLDLLCASILAFALQPWASRVTQSSQPALCFTELCSRLASSFFAPVGRFSWYFLMPDFLPFLIKWLSSSNIYHSWSIRMFLFDLLIVSSLSYRPRGYCHRGSLA